MKHWLGRLCNTRGSWRSLIMLPDHVTCVDTQGTSCYSKKERHVVPLRQETNTSFKWEAVKNGDILSALPQRQQNQRQLQPMGRLELEHGQKAEDTHGWQATFYSNHKANNTWWEFKVSVAKNLWALQTLLAKETSAALFSQLKAAWLATKPDPIVRTLPAPRRSDSQSTEGTADLGRGLFCTQHFWNQEHLSKWPSRGAETSNESLILYQFSPEMGMYVHTD